MTKISNISEVLERLWPKKLAQEWDNVGLLVGNAKMSVRKALLAIDITGDVVAEARRLGVQMIISYHPVIWDGLKNITADGAGSIIYELIRANIAVYSIHTSLDTAAGGVNDGLADALGIVNAEAIGDFVQNPYGEVFKLVVFVPAGSLEKVSKAIFKAGAGHIGNYSDCGFAAGGTGSFKPLKGSNPSIGAHGRIEKVSEMRFETIVPAEKLDNVIKAIHTAHPYEEPAFDVIKLSNPAGQYGLGRMGLLAEPAGVEQVIRRVKKVLGCKYVGIVGQARRIVRKAAVCAGSCGRIINRVIDAGCDLYLTGEIKHHQAVAAAERGLTCLCLSHSNSERFILRMMIKNLNNVLPRVKFIISKEDKDPFVWKTI